MPTFCRSAISLQSPLCRPIISEGEYGKILAGGALLYMGNMKTAHLLSLLPVLLVSLSHGQYTTTYPIVGGCQSRCLKQYGRNVDRESNRGQPMRVVDVHNNTEFSLCKLGCTSPSFDDLLLPPFRYGQAAHQTLLSTPQASAGRTKIVRHTSFLCIDDLSVYDNGTATTLILNGKVDIDVQPNAPATGLVHYVEVVAHGSVNQEASPAVVVFHDWCYSNACNVTLKVPSNTGSSNVKTSFQIRTSTFDESGPVGGVTSSRWYDLNQMVSGSLLHVTFVESRWLKDKAAAELEFKLVNSLLVPACTLILHYKSSVSSQFQQMEMSMDNSNGALLKSLDFAQIYQLSVSQQDARNRTQEGKILLGTTKFEVAPCLSMVADPSMCAPPPVPRVWSKWNLTNKNQHTLKLSWNYYASDDDDLQLGDSVATYKLTMSHFEISVTPLVTASNYQCQLLDPIRRDVTWTDRGVIFYLPDSKCNYEAEVIAVDIKRRKSVSSRIQISKVDEDVIMFLNTDEWGAPAIIIITIMSIFLVICTVCFLCRTRNQGENSIDKKVFKKDNENRVVLSYKIDPNDGSKTVVGKRVVPFEMDNFSSSTFHRNYNQGTPNDQVFQPVSSMAARLATANVQETLAEYAKASGLSKLYWKHNQSTCTDDENGYETICESSTSYDSTDSEVILSISNSPLDRVDRQDCFIAPVFARCDEFLQIPYFDATTVTVSQVKSYEENFIWKTATVVDRTCAVYILKFASTKESCKHLKRELEILDEMSKSSFCHTHIISFAGAAACESSDKICGIFHEHFSGGNLRNYLQRAGGSLRRSVQSCHLNSAIPLLHGTISRKTLSPSPPSSGYSSSLRSSGTTSPDLNFERLTRMISNRLCQFAESVACAIEYLHSKGILHRQISCTHIYLMRAYEDPVEIPCDQQVKLGDLGWASHSNVPSTAPPAANYLAPPEVLTGKPFEAKGDIWQFGLCLVEIATFGVPSAQRTTYAPTGIDHYDKSPATKLLLDASQKCLALRNRPSASDLKSTLHAFSVRSSRNFCPADLDHVSSVLI